jgi:hypothetical protein
VKVKISEALPSDGSIIVMIVESLKRLRQFVAEAADKDEARKVYDQIKDLAAQLERKHGFGKGRKRR